MINTQTRKCVSCGKKFTLTDSEIRFYESKGLQLPKRCADCREAKKARAEKAKKRSFAVFIPLALSAVATLFAYLSHGSAEYGSLCTPAIIISCAFFALFVLLVIRRITAVGAKNLNAAQSGVRYRFGSTADFKEHYKKHGREVGARSPKAYIEKANRLILSKRSVSKAEKEDGDTVYFNPKTGEIAFVSPQGVLRSYYISDADYYERQ